jgi:hypothetical protein
MRVTGAAGKRGALSLEIGQLPGRCGFLPPPIFAASRWLGSPRRNNSLSQPSGHQN